MLYCLSHRTALSVAVRPMFSETRKGAVEHIRRPVCNQWPEAFELDHGAIGPKTYKWLSVHARPGQTFTVK